MKAKNANVCPMVTALQPLGGDWLVINARDEPLVVCFYRYMYKRRNQETEVPLLPIFSFWSLCIYSFASLP